MSDNAVSFEYLRQELRDLRSDLKGSIDELSSQVRTQNGRVTRIERLAWLCGGGGAVVMWLVGKLWH